MAKDKKEVEELKVPVEVNDVVDVIETEGTIITDEIVNVEPVAEVVDTIIPITNEPTAEPEVEVSTVKIVDKCECDGLPFIVKNRKGSIKLCIKCNKPK
jgi:hypothetical protein